MVRNIDFPHARGYVAEAVGGHGPVVEMINRDGCFGELDFVVIITKISEGEQCFVFHLREDVYAPHCAREMRGVQQSGVHCCHDGSIWLFNLYAIYVWFHIFT